MICKYSKCDKKTKRRSNITTNAFRSYCSKEHQVLARAENDSIEFTGSSRGVGSEYDQANRELIKTAIEGSEESQEVLKTQGLTYHYRKGVGEWGKRSKP